MEKKYKSTFVGSVAAAPWENKIIKQSSDRKNIQIEKIDRSKKNLNLNRDLSPPP